MGQSGIFGQKILVKKKKKKKKNAKDVQILCKMEEDEKNMREKKPPRIGRIWGDEDEYILLGVD